MKKKERMLFFIFVIFFTLISYVSAVEIYINPPSQSVDVGSNFNVEVRGRAPTGGSDVYAVQYNLTYNPSILTFNPPPIEGPLLGTGAPSTVFTFSSVPGIVTVYNSRNGTTTGVNTPDDLFTTLSFTLNSAGTSPLNLANVIWVNSTITNQSVGIPGVTVTNGSVTNTPCQFTNAYWSTTSATEGNLVTLTVVGTSSCAGQAVNFTIWEDDFFPGDDDSVLINPANAVFSGSLVSTTWIAEWQGEGIPEVDPPEYYFNAVLVSNPSTNIQSSAPLLTVQKLISQDRVYVSPATQTVTHPATFNVSIKIQAPVTASDIYGLQFDLLFNPAVLSVNLPPTEGPILRSDGAVTLFDYTLTPGNLSMYNIRNQTNGSSNVGLYTDDGVLAIVNFSTVGGGSSLLDVANVIWVNSTIDNDTAMTITPIVDDGSVTVSAGGDTTPPIISNGQPTGTLAAGTTSTSISVATNEAATCKWSSTAGVAYTSMTNTFAGAGTTSHTSTRSGLTDGNSYTTYVRCNDTAGNVNTNDYSFTFSVASGGGPAVIVNVSSAYNLPPIYNKDVLINGVLTSTLSSEQWGSCTGDGSCGYGTDNSGPHWITVNFTTGPQTIGNVTMWWGWNTFRQNYMVSQQVWIQYFNSSSGSYQNTTAQHNLVNDNVTNSSYAFSQVSTTSLRLWQPANMGWIRLSNPLNNYTSVMWMTEVQWGTGGAVPNNPPVVSLISPTNGFTSTASSINFVGSVGDDTGITNVSLFINGVLNQTNTSGANGVNYNFNSILSNGAYTWFMRACDNIGQCTSSSTFSLTVSVAGDTTPPTLTLNSPADLSTTNNPLVTFSSTATDNVALLNVSLYVDGVFSQVNTSGINGVYLFSSTLSSGVHTWYVRACDTSSLCTTSSTRTITIDTTPPVRSNRQPVLDRVFPSGTTSVPFNLTTDETATCKYHPFPNQPYATMVATFSVTNGLFHGDNMPTADGQAYDIYVKCNDTVGNFNPDTDDYLINFSVAPTPIPSVDITSPLNLSTINNQNVTVVFNTVNWVVGGKGSNHIHFHVDGSADHLMFYNAPDNVVEFNQVVGPTPLATWINSNTVRINNLANGVHTIRTHLADPLHNPPPNPEAQETIQINILYCVDNDGDGYNQSASGCGIADCNDVNPSVNPGRNEICNGVDDDCNAGTSDGVNEPWYNQPTTCGVGQCSSTGVYTCSGGAQSSTCVPGTPSSETCDGLDNDCNGVNDNGGNSLCADSLWCNGDETCGGVSGCQAGTPVNCADSYSCTVDSCNESTDSCNNVENDALCSGGQVCNTVYFPPPTGCGVITACTGQPDGTACDDGLYCNGADRCQSQVCVDDGIPLNISDGVSCTVDSCNETTDTIEHPPNNAVCNNGLYCDGVEYCDSLLDCRSGTPVNCVNTDPYSCTVDSCNEATDACDIHTNDNSLCAPGETCDPIQFPAPTGCGLVVTCTDNDGDGYNVTGGSCGVVDCNDTVGIGATIYPGAPETCGDGIDNQCPGDSGYGQIDEGCPVGNCIVTNRYWSTTSATEGDLVDVVVEGNSDCNGQSVSFTVLEDDNILDEFIGGADDPATFNPNNVTFVNGVARSVWQAEWQDDGLLGLNGDPEYYFRANIQGVNYESPRGAGLLRVVLSQKRYEIRSVPLQTGKNSFSLPLIVDNTSVENVFKDIRSNVDTVYTYDNGFKIYHFDGRPSNLFNLEVGKGYFVFMNTPANLVINGSKRQGDLTRPTISLNPGWNLIGTFSNPYQASQILGGVSYTYLYTYNPLTGNYDSVNPTDNLQGERAYWIYVNNQSTIIPITGFSVENG